MAEKECALLHSTDNTQCNDSQDYKATLGINDSQSLNDDQDEELGTQFIDAK